MIKKRVLFVCIHNSARSQMAEAILRQSAGYRFEAKSAGIKPGELNPLAVDVLKEIGIDISQKKTRSVFDLLNNKKEFDYVITVCDESNAEKCPVFPGIEDNIHWSFEDPSRFEGTEEEKLVKTRVVRDQIKNRIEEWIKNN